MLKSPTAIAPPPAVIVPPPSSPAEFIHTTHSMHPVPSSRVKNVLLSRTLRVTTCPIISHFLVGRLR
jgi:hypothetical protein